MRLCIPVRQPLGLDSEMEPNLPSAEHLLFFDTESRVHETLSLLQTPSGTGTAPSFGAVLCGSINRVTLRALIERGILVYGTEAQTVAGAIAQYEMGELCAVPSAGSGGCGSHGNHGHAHGTGGCGGGGCGSHNHEHGETGCGGGGCGGHGCGCGSHDHEQAHAEDGHVCGGGGCGGHAQAHEPASGEDSEPRELGDVLRIAVTSQNRKTITEHAGKCRKFWVYEIRKGQVVAKDLIELPKDQSFHEAKSAGAHPLDDIHVLISSGMGTGLQQRLRQRGIQGLVTAETDPDQAVALYLEAALADIPPQRAWVSTCSQEKAEA